MSGTPSMGAPHASELAELVARLPEVYQPIYGHPELASSRTPEGPRMDALRDVVDLLAGHLDRKLRILDLGSAQGYVCFRLAEAAHHATGIDFLPDNVAVAQLIADQNPELDVEFRVGDVADVASVVNLKDFDVVIGLSVLHHVAHRDGHEAAVAAVATLARDVPHGIFEMALAAEPLYWAESLPEDPRMTLSSYAFIRQIGRSPTHLSAVQRPVLYCSQALALVGGALHPIQSWSNRSHSQSTSEQQASSRYYMLPIGVEKCLARFAPGASEHYMSSMRQEMRREARLLPALASAGVEAPELLEFVDAADETLLVRSTYPGEPLSDMVDLLNDDERATITTQILEQLAALEEHGLYHGDLRLWNVVYDRGKQQAHLIDFGAVYARPTDVVWPNDAYFSFLLFFIALWGAQPDQTGALIPRTLRVDAAVLPARVVEFVGSLLSHADDDHVFADSLKHWQNDRGQSGAEVWPSIPLAWNWLGHIELQRAAATAATSAAEAAAAAAIAATAAERGQREQLIAELDAERAARGAVELELEGARAAIRELELRNAQQTTELSTVAERVSHLERHNVSLESERQAAAAEQVRLQARLDDAQLQLELMRHTLSWRLTRPIRAIRRLGRRA